MLPPAPTTARMRRKARARARVFACRGGGWEGSAAGSVSDEADRRKTAEPRSTTKTAQVSIAACLRRCRREFHWSRPPTLHLCVGGLRPPTPPAWRPVPELMSGSMCRWAAAPDTPAWEPVPELMSSSGTARDDMAEVTGVRAGLAGDRSESERPGTGHPRPSTSGCRRWGQIPHSMWTRGVVGDGAACSTPNTPRTATDPPPP